MRIIRNTRSWFDPREQKYTHVQRLKVEDQGQVDLVSSYCNRSQKDPGEVQDIVHGLIDEFMGLIASGHTVNIPGLGVVGPQLECRQRRYEEASKFNKADITGIKFKLHQAQGFARRIKSILESIEIH